MKEDRLALLKSVDSGDTNLGLCQYVPFVRNYSRGTVYLVLLDLHKRLSLGDFFRLIDEGGAQLTLASKLLQAYAREHDRELLRDFYYSDDRRVESAILLLEDAYWMTVGGFA